MVQRKLSGLLTFLGEGLGNSYLNIQRTVLGAEIGAGESKWSPKHLGQVLHEGVVRYADAYKLGGKGKGDHQKD